MGLFDGIKEAQASRSAQYVTPGQYVARIDAVKAGENRQKVPNFIIEMTVLHLIQATEVSYPVGHKMSHVISQGNKDYFLPDIKAFISCAAECDESDVDEDTCTMACGEEQPLEGRVVEVHAITLITKEAKKEFTKVAYEKSISFSELPGILSTEEIERFYPGDILAQLIAEESS